MEISQYRLAKDLSVDPRRINEIIHGNRSISADTALRLGRYLGTSARFWFNLRSHFDLEVEEQDLGTRLEEEVAVHALDGHATHFESDQDAFGCQFTLRERLGRPIRTIRLENRQICLLDLSCCQILRERRPSPTLSMWLQCVFRRS